MASWLRASQVKGLFSSTQHNDLPPISSGEELPPLPVEGEQAKGPKRHSGFLRLKRLAITVLTVAFVVAVLLAFKQQIISLIYGPTQAQVLADLDGKITKWQSNRDRLKQLLEQMQKDKTSTLDKLDQLGVKSESDVTSNPKAKVLVTELTDIVKQMSVYDKKYQEYDLAILKCESRVRNIARQLAAKEAGVTDEDLDELSRSMASLDESLASDKATAFTGEVVLKDELARYHRGRGSETSKSPDAIPKPEPTPEPRRPVDLLALIDIARHSMGKWTFSNSRLTSPANEAAQIRIPYTLPDIYSLTLVAKRTTKPSKGHCFLDLRCFAGKGHGVLLQFDVHGRHQDNSVTTHLYGTAAAHDGLVFNQGREETVVCNCRRDSCVVKVNSKQIIRWQGDYRTLMPGVPSDQQRGIRIDTNDSGFVISKIQLEPLP
jgi:hypothetical protein